MRDYKSLAHTKWDCKYHLVFIPKYRKKKIYGKLREYLGEILHELASHRESKIEEGHLMGDQIGSDNEFAHRPRGLLLLYVPGSSVRSRCENRRRFLRELTEDP